MELYDVIVIGGGPAGLTAAIYLARAKYRVLVLEEGQLGGQITITHQVVNYPGIEEISGQALTEAMYRQAKNFGAEFATAQATGIEVDGDVKTVHTQGQDYRCYGILLATGARPRMVGFEGEAEFKGHGVAYCATCDGAFFTDKEVFVIGGGYAAAEESVFLTKYASHVTVLIRGEGFSCASGVAEPAMTHEKITVLPHTQMKSVSGDGELTELTYENTQTGQITHRKAPRGDSFGVFVFAGYAPATDWIKGTVACDEKGYLITDATKKTNIDGVFGAGDVCQKPLRQVVTATADGALAATGLEKYAAAMHKKTGVVPPRPQQREHTAAQQDTDWISADMESQLRGLFDRLTKSVTLRLTLDERKVSEELRQLMEKLATYSEKIQVSTDGQAQDAPCVALFVEGENTGIGFHGVPSGHEFTSFVLGIYNAAGPGQPIEEALKARIAKLSRKTDLQILVSLSCTMCPELVLAAQQIAACNPLITAHAYDLQHFPHLQKAYKVMSVPCLVADGKVLSFGKKSMAQLLDLLEKQ